MRFPAGNTIMLISAFLLLGIGGGATLRKEPPIGEMVLWTFDPGHAATYRSGTPEQPSLVDLYRHHTGKTLRIEVMPSRVLDARLISATLAGISDDTVPDLVELEIGSIGKYLRQRPAGSALLPLNEYIRAAGLGDAISAPRLATWTRDGQIMGVPRDVNPVSLTYRDDLFAAAGIDLAKCDTWESFREACLRYQRHSRAHGRQVSAMQLSRWNAAELNVMLQQQRIELVDGNGKPTIASPEVARTIAFYARLVAGDSRIAEQVADSAIGDSLASGDTAALLTPDWRVSSLWGHRELLGKLRMMPLPRFAVGDAPTASWGGTVIAIPRGAKDPDGSWELLRELHLTPDALRARLRYSEILPAVIKAWDDPARRGYSQLFGGQSIGSLYVDLARDLPQQRVSPYSQLIGQAISGVLSAAQRNVEVANAGDVEMMCARDLVEAQRQLERVLDFAAEDR